MKPHGHALAEHLTLPPPWDAALIPVSAFPIAGEELAQITSFVEKFAHAATGGSMSSETFIQVEQSDDRECRRIYLQRAREWIPEVGLGVWPAREPPATWTQEEILSLLPGKKIRPLMHQVLRITTSPKAKSEAFNAMFPFGPALRIWTADDGETFLEKATSLLLPPIKDPSYTCYPFYVPLLDRQACETATVEQLDAWACGASLYVRESFEDKGILIASREPLAPMIEKLGGRFESGEKPRWHIPT